jgi:hypothetical protein
MSTKLINDRPPCGTDFRKRTGAQRFVDRKQPDQYLEPTTLA